MAARYALSSQPLLGWGPRLGLIGDNACGIATASAEHAMSQSGPPPRSHPPTRPGPLAARYRQLSLGQKTETLLRSCSFVDRMSASSDRCLRGSEWVSVRMDFDSFYRDCRDDMVRALVLAVGVRDLGVDAADEAFARALERWDEVGGYENPQGWVYRVGLNCARSHLRRRRFGVDGLFGSSVHLDELPEPELLEAVEDLPFEFRAVVVARFFLDWSIEQTAAALGIPEGTVKTRQSRAVARLRRRLGARFES